MSEKFVYDFPMAANTASVIPYYVNHGTYRTSVVLVKRKHDPYKGMLAIPGGFLNAGAESLEGCAVRELKEETNIVKDVVDLEEVCTNSNPGRDPRQHVIDRVFAVELNEADLLAASANDDAESLHLIDTEEFDTMELAFDHAISLNAFLVKRSSEA